MKTIIIVLLCLTFVSCANHQTIENITELESEIIDTIANLSEVITLQNSIVKSSKGKRNLRFWIYEKLENTEKDYYWVKVSEDNGVNLVSHFNFHVYPQNMAIKYFDTVQDTLLTLESWREREAGN